MESLAISLGHMEPVLFCSLAYTMQLTRGDVWAGGEKSAGKVRDPPPN
jgi:hypothetical protein